MILKKHICLRAVFLYIIISGLGCGLFYPRNHLRAVYRGINPSKKSVEKNLRIAEKNVRKSLAVIGVDMSGKSVVFRGYDVLKQCKYIANSEATYEEVEDQLEDSFAKVSVIILDEQLRFHSEYSLSLGYFSNNEEHPNYHYKSDIINLIIENDYLIVYESFLCEEQYLVGYRHDLIDVYKVVDEQNLFLYRAKK